MIYMHIFVQEEALQIVYVDYDQEYARHSEEIFLKSSIKKATSSDNTRTNA
jgi:hypothetical protein